MSEPWFTEDGATGTRSIERREGNWFVTAPSGAGGTKCILDDAVEPASGTDEQTVAVRVSSFRPGTGGGVTYLFVDSADGTDAESVDGSASGTAAASGTATTASSGGGSPSGTRRSSNDERDLADFRGSGEHVDVETTVDSACVVRKDESGTPDVKGELTDDSVLNPVHFVVQHGVTHPYLEEGTQLGFGNVKDYFYRGEAEVQALITEHTRFEQL